MPLIGLPLFTYFMYETFKKEEVKIMRLKGLTKSWITRETKIVC